MNNRIRVARGSRNNIVNSTETLAKGQIIYNTTDNYIGVAETDGTLPKNVKRPTAAAIEGYTSDLGQLSSEENKSGHYSIMADPILNNLYINTPNKILLQKEVINDSTSSYEILGQFTKENEKSNLKVDSMDIENIQVKLGAEHSNIGTQSRKFENIYADNFKGTADNAIHAVDADNATKDNSGNIISDTYFKKSDMQISGKYLTFQKSGNPGTKFCIVFGTSLNQVSHNDEIALTYDIPKNGFYNIQVSALFGESSMARPILCQGHLVDPNNTGRYTHLHLHLSDSCTVQYLIIYSYPL